MTVHDLIVAATVMGRGVYRLRLLVVLLILLLLAMRHCGSRTSVKNYECLPNDPKCGPPIENYECLPNDPKCGPPIENYECLPNDPKCGPPVKNYECLPNDPKCGPPVNGGSSSGSVELKPGQ
jgi:hypothetical protein